MKGLDVMPPPPPAEPTLPGEPELRYLPLAGLLPETHQLALQPDLGLVARLYADTEGVPRLQHVQWFTPIEAAAGRHGGHDAAISGMPGIVLSGGWDGVLRALASGDGKILWDFDMVRDFETVNGVPAKGGSVGAAGPTVAGGMVFAGAGYPGVQNGLNGNVLLAFGVE